MVSKYKYKEKNNKINCSITVLSGVDDIITENEVTLWNKYTAKEFNIYFLKGNHFFINDEDNIIKISNIINKTLLK